MEYTMKSQKGYMYNKKNKTTVQQKSEELIDYTFVMTDSINRYPKKYRFTFVDRMQNLALDIHTGAVKANELPISSRKPLQINILSDLEVLITLIEISLNRSFIDHEECERWTNKALDVKRLAAAWMHRTK